MLIHELLSKDPDIVIEEAPLIILDINSAVCLTNNGKNNNYTSHIPRRVNSVINGDKCKIHDIDWCKVGL